MRSRFTTLAQRLNSPSGAAARPWASVAASQNSSAACPARPNSTDAKCSTTGPDLAGSPAAKIARIEAALLLAREALSTRKLAELADLADGTEARALVRELGRRMRRRGSAMLPVEVA